MSQYNERAASSQPSGGALSPLVLGNVLVLAFGETSDFSRVQLYKRNIHSDANI